MASSRKSLHDSAALAQVASVLGRHVGRGDRLVAGVSGGIDSVVLLDVLARLARKAGFELVALHVNHQINPRAAGWARFCQAYCRKQDVALTVVKVSVPRVGSLEAAARQARYAAFAALPADFIALAHNLDDQAETVLLQLLRGSGVKGVSAMPEIRRQDSGAGVQELAAGGIRSGSGLSPHPESCRRSPAILRPLLDIPRSEIEAYALSRQLEWIEDDSNADTAFDRNYVRHRVLPAIAERYPAYRKTLARAARNFAEAGDLLDELARCDARISGTGLAIEGLRGLSVPRAKNAIRFFLAGRGVAMPNSARLEECVRQLRQPRAASIAIDLGTHELRRYAGELRVVANAAAPATGYSFLWRGESRLRLPELDAILVMKKSRGAGISLAKLLEAPVSVKLRQGGERLRPDSRRPRRTLKNLLQEARLPPWLRDRLPLIYCGDALVYAPGIGIDCAFAAVAGEAAIEPHFESAALDCRK